MAAISEKTARDVYALRCAAESVMGDRSSDFEERSKVFKELTSLAYDTIKADSPAYSTDIMSVFILAAVNGRTRKDVVDALRALGCIKEEDDAGAED